VLNIGLGLAKQVVDISRRAGAEIMKVYQTDFAVDEKADSSPVTEADQLAEDVILRSIREGITGEYPIVSEEAFSAGNAPVVRDQVFWLVDPLDGTKEFISRNGEFTVNVALIENTRPILGVVHLPAQNVTYFGFNMGAFRMSGDQPRQEIKCRPAPAGGLSALVSRSHRTPEVDTYLQKFQIANEVSAGSSLKFCRLAEAAADIYPRMGRTMEWDTAAGHAVLRFAGGTVQRLDGSELGYGKEGFENPHFVAAGPGVLGA
jgi:3'(2'), 5'-bisphosphate nucleotidase